MNPRKLGKLANHDQEPWKAQLPLFLEEIYFKRFKRERPAVVMWVEERAQAQQKKKAARKEAKRQKRQARAEEGQGAAGGDL